jgi:hypothetical protein
MCLQISNSSARYLLNRALTFFTQKGEPFTAYDIVRAVREHIAPVYGDTLVQSHIGDSPEKFSEFARWFFSDPDAVARPGLLSFYFGSDFHRDMSIVVREAFNSRDKDFRGWAATHAASGEGNVPAGKFPVLYFPLTSSMAVSKWMKNELPTRPEVPANFASDPKCKIVGGNLLPSNTETNFREGRMNGWALTFDQITGQQVYFRVSAQMGAGRVRAQIVEAVGSAQMQSA